MPCVKSDPVVILLLPLPAWTTSIRPPAKLMMSLPSKDRYSPISAPPVRTTVLAPLPRSTVPMSEFDIVSLSLPL